MWKRRENTWCGKIDQVIDLTNSDILENCSLFEGQFVDILGGMMMSKYEDTNSILAITETLAALGDNNQGTDR